MKISVADILPEVWSLLPVRLRRRIVRFTHPAYTIGVSAVLLNERDEILYLRHRYREHRGWELPGGLIKSTETLEAALAREVREETGYSVEILSLVAASIGPPRHVDICFLARIHAGTLSIDRDEILEARFFAPPDLPSVLREEQLATVDRAMRALRIG